VPRKAGDGGGAIHSIFDSNYRLGEDEMNQVLNSIKE
jgi:hypothetical protein